MNTRPTCTAGSQSLNHVRSLFIHHRMVIFHDSKYSQPWPGIHLYCRWKEITHFYRFRYYAPTVSFNSYQFVCIQQLYLCAFVKREGRRLRMLRGLPGIQHKVSSVSLHYLGGISALGMHSMGPSIFGIGPPNTIFGFGSNIMSFGSPCGSSSIPKWDERCKCMNVKNGNMRCII